VTVWEFSDRYSWIPSTYPGMGEAGLFNDKLSGKWELLPIVMQAMTP
jgi:endo-1,4-beta-xylanase